MTSIIHWKNIPVVRLLLPMIAGLLIGIYGEFKSTSWIFGLVLSSVVIAVLLFSSKRKPSLAKEISFGVSTYAMLFFLGVNLIVFNTSHNRASHYLNVKQETTNYVVRVTEIPKEKPKSIQIIAEVTHCLDSNRATATTGLVLLYIAKDSLSKEILQGDILFVKSNLQDIAPPMNPGQFDYKQYLAFHQIYQQGFVKGEDWKVTETNHYSIIRFASKTRDNLLSILESNGLQGQELAVASALILGYKEDLGDELKHSYSSAGATHVLAVSGLHVGIIFMVLNFLFLKLDKNEKRKTIRALALIICLWAYATITGLSPSVMRAATMFTFVAVGKLLQRKSSIYNTLAASAFALLSYNPYLIMEVGFQLSYLAVIGIVYFQKIIYKRIYVSNKYLDYLWSITSVSIAAQLTTFPLGLLYFHQFPTYFFISNLIVIPGAMIIIGLGILLFATSWIPYVGTGVGWGLSKLIFAMNYLVFSIDKLPYSLVEGISITIVECWLIYFVIIHFVMSYETRKLKYSIVALCLVITLFAIDIAEDFSIKETKEIVIYQIKNEQNLNFIDANANFFVAANHLQEDKNTMLFNVFHHWDDLDAEQPTYLPFHSTGKYDNFAALQNYYLFYDKRIAVVDTLVTVGEVQMEVDILYLLSPSYMDTAVLFRNYKPAVIVIGNEVDYKLRKQLISGNFTNTKIHYLKKDGAFVLSF